MQADHNLTGNDYISVCSIDRAGCIDGLTALHSGLAGLVEWTGGDGDPLIRPRLRVDGQDVDLAGARWQRLDRWIPSFTLDLDNGLTVSGEVCAPGGYPAARGFHVRIAVRNRGRAVRTASVEFDVAWSATRLWIGTGRPLGGTNALLVTPDRATLVLEAGGGAAGPVLAMSCGNRARIDVQPSAAAEETAPRRARIAAAVDVAGGASESVTLCVGVGRERDGAVAACASLRRYGADHWLRQARMDLSLSLRAAQDQRWAELLNRNLIFARYFGVGRAIDDDRLHFVRSRNPACALPALFNEREVLLFLIPALVVVDTGLARESILRVLETFSDRSGEFLRYLDGGAYDSGFSFDSFMLYPWVIDHYTRETGDLTILDDPLVRQIVVETDATAFVRLHPEHMLGATELLPSGDIADFPYTTTSNVLLHAFAASMPRLAWPAEAGPPRFEGAAAEIAAAVWQHCLADVGGEHVLASSSSLAGDTAVYDDPAISLALLPFLGFCSGDDPVWLATMEFLRSRRYPLWLDGAVPGLAARSDPTRARTSALCADLLGADPAGALARLQRVRFPGGIAAATYDPATGVAEDGWDAAHAGLLAWTLARAADPPAGRKPRGRRR